MILLFIFSQAICDFEDNIYHTISDDWQTKPVTCFMQGVNFVSYPPFDIVPPAVFHFSKKKEIAKHGVIGFIGDCATVLPLKFVINRERPEGDHPRWDSSFPSGHTTFSFTQAVIYSHYYPKLKIPFYLYATIVAFSRIYLGKHYPTDVIGGAALGITVGALTIKLFK